MCTQLAMWPEMVLVELAYLPLAKRTYHNGNAEQPCESHSMIL